MSISLNLARLKECRERMGITKMEAAKRMSLSQPAYLRYESGERTPSFQTLTVIAKVLNTSTEYLTDQSDDPAPVSYTFDKSDNPVLFEIIESCKNADKDTLNRIFTYVKKISKESKSLTDEDVLNHLKKKAKAGKLMLDE